jgi:hypothetical protein
LIGPWVARARRGLEKPRADFVVDSQRQEEGGRSKSAPSQLTPRPLLAQGRGVAREGREHQRRDERYPQGPRLSPRRLPHPQRGDLLLDAICVSERRALLSIFHFEMRDEREVYKVKVKKGVMVLSEGAGGVAVLLSVDGVGVGGVGASRAIEQRTTQTAFAGKSSSRRAPPPPLPPPPPLLLSLTLTHYRTHA